MQQTEKYKLNLIDPEDEFSPEPLNQNAETVEAQLQAREAAEAALQTAIGAGGKTCRIAYGTFAGGSGRTLTFDFKPLAVAITCGTGGGYYQFVILLRSVQTVEPTDNRASVTWRDNGISVSYGMSGYSGWYVALGESA